MEWPKFNGKRFVYDNVERVPRAKDEVLIVPVLEPNSKLIWVVYEEWPWQVIHTTQPVAMEDGRLKSLFRVDDVVKVEFIEEDID